MNISVILPTINEAGNLSFLIPQLLENETQETHFQIIVVDDSSVDGTQELVREFSKKNSNVSLIERENPNGLPGAILAGIQESKGDLVAWMDSDGSMPIDVLIKMLRFQQVNQLDLVIGSRFVSGGGFKGLNESGSTSIFQFIRNIHNSQDKVLAVFLSRILNMSLRILLRSKIKDITSGFILIKRDLIINQSFIGSYGEYCPILLSRLEQQKIKLAEFGYVCIPRIYGESKTGQNLFDYIKRGFPYLHVAVKEMLTNKFFRENS